MTKELNQIQLNEIKHNSHNKNELTVISEHNCDLVNQKLPDNFFEKIITTEIELTEEFSHEKLTLLFQLYSTAIQYYSLNDISKVKIYQNRMEYYLTQKDTLKNLTKFNIEKKIGNQSIPNSRNILPKVRGIAKAKFKLKAKEIKKEDIRKQVKLLLKDVVVLMKIDKKNLRDIMNSELIRQRKIWVERLYQKRALNNSSSTRIRTVSGKVSFTPSMEVRKSLDLENKGKFEKSGKNLYKYRMIDDESSEIDDSRIQKENDVDFLNLLKEIDGAKSMVGDSDDDSIIGSSYEEEEESESETKEEEEEEEEEEEKDKSKIKKYVDKLENDSRLNKSKDIIKRKYKAINEIDEKDEFNQNNNLKRIQINIQEINPNKNPKYISSKYLPRLLLSPPEEDEEKQILPTDKKEKIEEIDRKEENNSLKANNIINEINNQVPHAGPTPAKRRKSIDTENVIRNIELDEEIRNIIAEKMKKIYNIHEENTNMGGDSNFQSTNSLPSVQRINFEEMSSKFNQVIFRVENKVKQFVGKLNKHFYSEVFDKFYSKIKEIYEQKYEKYLKVNEEYFSNIKENEFMIDSNDKMEKFEKIQIQNIIECLKEEQKDQIDEILDEYNSNINKYIEEFKQNLFVNDIGYQIIEEQLKLDIYTMINEAFY